LIDALRRDIQLSPSALLREILDKLREFCRGEQQDDITLIVGKC
jgi:serine phosphatase RsbU (regulator of sigma subunit)